MQLFCLAQELKEILAKQQELGFELPELPPGYLSETEDQGNEKKVTGKLNAGILVLEIVPILTKE